MTKLINEKIPTDAENGYSPAHRGMRCDQRPHGAGVGGVRGIHAPLSVESCCGHRINITADPTQAQRSGLGREGRIPGAERGWRPPPPPDICPSLQPRGSHGNRQAGGSVDGARR